MIDRRLILDSFQTVRSNTIQVAQDIPADQYGFRPVPEVRSVLEQLRAIIEITEFMTASALSEHQPDPRDKTREELFRELCHTDCAPLQTKDAVIAGLAESMEWIQGQVNAADEEYLASTFRAIDGATKIRLWAIQCGKEQEMAIRSQLFLYQRLLGITPHFTRLQQERTAARTARPKA